MLAEFTVLVKYIYHTSYFVACVVEEYIKSSENVNKIKKREKMHLLIWTQKRSHMVRLVYVLVTLADSNQKSHIVVSLIS